LAKIYFSHPNPPPKIEKVEARLLRPAFLGDKEINRASA
jgi:tRNA G46 methylase TrmB